MSFSFLDNLDVDEDDPQEEVSQIEVSETPTKLKVVSEDDVGSPTLKKKKNKKSDNSDTGRSPTTSGDHSHVGEHFKSQSSPASPGLRRSKRIAKKVNDDPADAEEGRETMKGRRGRKKQAARKDGKSSEMDGNDHRLSDVKVPPKKDTSTMGSVAGEKVEPPSLYRAPPRELQLLPTTPRRLHNPSLLKVALGNASQKKSSTSHGAKRRSVGGEGDGTGIFRQQQSAIESEPSKEPKMALTSDIVTDVEVKTRIGRVKKAGKRTVPRATSNDTESIISVRESAKHPSINKQAAAMKGQLAKDSAVDTQLPPPRKIAKQQTTTVMGSTTKHNANQTRIPMRNVDSNNDSLDRKTTQPNASKAVDKKASPEVPPKSDNTTKSSVPRKTLTKEGFGKNSEPRRNLKSIVKQSSLKQSKTKTTARVTMALAAMADKPVKEEEQKPAKKQVVMVAPRKSFKFADQYKHVQSKVAQMINSGTSTMSTGSKVRDMKNTGGTANSDTKAPAKPLHDKPFLLGGRLRPDTSIDDGRSRRTTMASTGALLTKKNVQGQKLSRKTKAVDSFEFSVRSAKSMVPSNPEVSVFKQPKFHTVDARRRTTLKAT